jgi:hypothetical protein
LAKTFPVGPYAELHGAVRFKRAHYRPAGRREEVLMTAFVFGLALALLVAFSALAEPELQCAPGEASVDLSPRMPPGVTAVWVIFVGAIA